MMKESAGNIIRNALKSEKTVKSYYGESEIKVYQGDELIENSIMTEYVSDDGNRKIISKDKISRQETAAFNDGSKIIFYNKTLGEAYETEMGMTDMLRLSDPREQLKMMLDMTEDSHECFFVGEEPFLDLDTYHLKLKQKEDDSLFGDVDLWVEQKSSFIVKMTMESAASKIEMEYKEINFSPTFAEGIFSVNIPENIEISSLEKTMEPAEVSLREAAETLGQNFLKFSEDDMKLVKVTLLDYRQSIGRFEVELEYETLEGTPLLSMSVFPTPEGPGMGLGRKNITVRGKKAKFEKMINGITWDEDGLRYSVIMHNPDVPIEDMISMAANMK